MNPRRFRRQQIITEKQAGLSKGSVTVCKHPVPTSYALLPHAALQGFQCNTQPLLSPGITAAAAARRSLPGTVRMLARLLGLLAALPLSLAAAAAAAPPAEESAAAAAARSAALAVTGGSASPMDASGASGAWEEPVEGAAVAAADAAAAAAGVSRAGAAWMDPPTSCARGAASCSRERRCTCRGKAVVQVKCCCVAHSVTAKCLHSSRLPGG